MTRGGGRVLLPAATAGDAAGAAAASAPLVEREVAYALAAIQRVARNESAWSYLRGVLRGRPLAAHPRVLEVRERGSSARSLEPCVTRALLQVAEAVRSLAEPAANVFANELLADAALEQHRDAAAAARPAEDGTDSRETAGAEVIGLHAPTALSRAAALFRENAVYDSVRAGFWDWRASQCQ